MHAKPSPNKGWLSWKIEKRILKFTPFIRTRSQGAKDQLKLLHRQGPQNRTIINHLTAEPFTIFSRNSVNVRDDIKSFGKISIFS